MRVPTMALAAALLVQAAGPGSGTPLPDRAAFVSLVRSALRLDFDIQSDFTYVERRRDVKVSPFGKVTIGPLRTFDVFPSTEPGQTYKRLVEIDGHPLSPAELRRRDLEHHRDVEKEEERRRFETPAQQARSLESLERERRQAAAMLDDAMRVFEATVLSREQIDGESTIVVQLTPRADARVMTREGSWMKEFEGRAWFVEKDGQLAQLDVHATDDVSIGWGIVGRVHKGSRIVVERGPVGGLWLPRRLTLNVTGRTLLFRAFDINIVTEYSDYKKKSQ